MLAFAFTRPLARAQLEAERLFPAELVTKEAVRLAEQDGWVVEWMSMSWGWRADDCLVGGWPWLGKGARWLGEWLPH
jgi:hypothetical protein